MCIMSVSMNQDNVFMIKQQICICVELVRLGVIHQIIVIYVIAVCQQILTIRVYCLGIAILMHHDVV
jgi:hypothetical protein